MSEEKADLTPSKILTFFAHLGQAKRTYRSGWVLRGVKEAESIADHMYRMSVMSFLAPDNLNKQKCIEMCLIHDLAESITGDFTPCDNVSKEEKRELENSAFNKLVNMVGSESKRGKEMKQLYDEYVLHESDEAKYVKSLDLFDMFLAAYEYELGQKVDLSEFFSQVPKCLDESSFFTPQVKEWTRELMRLREKKVDLRPFDSNLNTVLREIILNKQQ